MSFWNKESYISDYLFNWETIDVICGGKSSLDAKNYLTEIYDLEQVKNFLNGYGFDLNNPVENAELFGIFHESLQFIKRYFLKEGNSDGLEFSIPSFLYTITDISEVFLTATSRSKEKRSREEELWSGIVLKVMHTILHTDKDLRSGYFNIIQTQIFDRFYRYLHRDEKDQLFLKNDQGSKIKICDFQTKAKKSRDSIIIKLLHKKENVAEELFDRIGIRIVAESKIDVLRIIKFLYVNYVIITNNIKPSRSQNTLINFDYFKKESFNLTKRSIRGKIPENIFYQELSRIADESFFDTHSTQNRNEHTIEEYRAIHFTGRHLIKYRNPFVSQYNEVKKLALEDKNSDLAKKVLALDTSSISTDVRFFYPFEVQLTDKESHFRNTQGEASHQEYKKAQVKSAMLRIFKPLLEHLGREVS